MTDVIVYTGGNLVAFARSCGLSSEKEIAFWQSTDQIIAEIETKRRSALASVVPTNLRVSEAYPSVARDGVVATFSNVSEDTLRAVAMLDSIARKAWAVHCTTPGEYVQHMALFLGGMCHGHALDLLCQKVDGFEAAIKVFCLHTDQGVLYREVSVVGVNRGGVEVYMPRYAA